MILSKCDKYQTLMNWPVFDNPTTVLPAKSDSDVLFCLQSHQVLSLVY